MMASPKAKDPLRHEAYVLKQLQSLSAWRGSLVEYGLTEFVVPYLQSGNLPPVEQVIANTLAVGRRQYNFSLRRRYRDPGVSKTANKGEFCALFPHEYDLEVSAAELAKVGDEVRTAIENFYNRSEFLQRLSRHQWYSPKFRFFFTLGRANVQVELDLLIFRGWNQPIIVDWKVVGSEKSDYKWQMLIYALAVWRKWPEIKAGEITVLEARLLEGAIREHVITRDKLNEAEDYLYQGILEIEAVTDGKSYQEQDVEDYELARSPNTCLYCNFRRLCLNRR